LIAMAVGEAAAGGEYRYRTLASEPQQV